ncbi:glycerophosphodiester phosphodiesterase [Effusibacillus dendaii]|uniref:Glycerophosphoryl diester phosphodiesterase n=1 Tax=Effusibacillus dendaii TaxID=2743772 RepID=A0A7I8DF81_9BACL|nr:glycerophosphodiester phosphodiesterase [Effusibacillus dendaii]BCJ86571.1 glycerophosphoryl diester phosphodiesterase [Effusibacillus dendaii]
MERLWKRSCTLIGTVCLGMSISLLHMQTVVAKQQSIYNVAHRGASGYAPENTMAAYEMAQTMKPDFIELDVQMTKDGVLVVMHDEKVDRTTNGTGYVKDHTLAEIKRLDAGSWFNNAYPDKSKAAYVGLAVPAFEEVVAKFGRNARFFIELKSPEKYPAIEQKLLQILEKNGLLDGVDQNPRVIVESFNRDSLLRMHQLNRKVPLVQLIEYKTPAVVTDAELQAIKQYAIGVAVNGEMMDRAYVQQVTANGMQIYVYTVNEKKTMEKMARWHVTGLFTNYPDRLHEVLNRKGNT